MSLEITIKPSEKLSDAEIKFLESGKIKDIIIDNSGEITTLRIKESVVSLCDIIDIPSNYIRTKYIK